MHSSLSNYRPTTKLGEGNVFTCVCQSFCPGGVGISGTRSFLDVDISSGYVPRMGEVCPEGVVGCCMSGGGYVQEWVCPVGYGWKWVCLGDGYVQGEVGMSMGGGGYPPPWTWDLRYNGIWSVSGRYASYLNAFLYLILMLRFHTKFDFFHTQENYLKFFLE